MQNNTNGKGEDGSWTSSQVEILNETKTFYEKLDKRKESFESIAI